MRIEGEVSQNGGIDSVRKIVGIVIIAFSLLLGLFCAINFLEQIVVANIILWLISLPLYISGQIIRTSRSKFKQQGKGWVASYLFFFFIIPLLIYLNIFYEELKETIFIDEQFVLYEPASGKLGKFSLGGFIVILIFLFGARFLNPDIKRKGLLNAIIIGTIIFLIGFNYLMFSDYRGIHEEQGLVSSNWRGEEKIISFDEWESVYLEPYVHYASLSNTSDETRFVWKVIFQTDHSKEVVYHFNMLTKSGLEETIAIKELVMDKKVPFIIGEMNQETLAFFNNDLEYEELEKERYYELFQVKYK